MVQTKAGTYLSFGVHRKYIRYILNAGRRDRRFFPLPSFFSAIFKPTRRKPGPSHHPARLVSDSGTKAAPLLGSVYRGCVILSFSYRNASASLSLRNSLRLHLFHGNLLYISCMARRFF